MTDITELAQQELAQLRAELSNQAIGSKDHLRKIALSLVDKLEKYRDREIRWLALSDEKSKIITDQEEALEKAQQHIARQEQILLNQDESLSIRRGELEAAQQERENWRTSFDNERFRADKLKAHIDVIEPVHAAAEKLVRCKGRYHSEQNYLALAALFGVTTPDLPPLDSESRTVTVKLVDINEFLADVHDKTLALAFRRLAEGVREADIAALTAQGIKWEAE